MELKFFLQSLLIGFSIAAPVGPIGVLCIRRTLTYGRRSGLASGLGAATADAVYGSIAGFGLTFISAFLISQQFWLSLIGGLFLCYLGLKIFLAPTPAMSHTVAAPNHAGAFTSTFFLTLTNPATIISFTAIFAGLGLASTDGNYFLAAVLVLGVFTGSALWWLTLSSVVGLFRSKLTPNRLRWVNRAAGVMLVILGVLILASMHKISL